MIRTDFTELRDNVEQIATVVRRSDSSADTTPSEQQAQETAAAASAALTFGQTLVGIYEELAGIRAALERMNVSGGFAYEPGPASQKPYDQEADR